jgi:outer membrane protein assembly factor BamD (BamD/ComL family)
MQFISFLLLAASFLPLADRFFLKGNYQQAIKQYQAVLGRNISAPLKEKTFFKLGECFFYQGNLKKAGNYYTLLTTRYPRGSWVNDALRRLIFIKENQKVPPEELDFYFQAQRSFKRKDFQVALEKLEKISSSPLVEFAQLEVASIYTCRGEEKRALQILEEVGEKIREGSYLFFLVQMKLTRILLGRGEKEKAKERLESILIKYPESIFCAEIRKELKKLREE